MRLSLALLMAAAGLAVSSVPADAAAGSFVLVNGTKLSLSQIAIRRFGTQDWKPLNLSPPAGGSGPVEFSDPDCAFDIRGKAGSTDYVWSGVNLCEAKIVTLRRNEGSGALWVDYD